MNPFLRTSALLSVALLMTSLATSPAAAAPIGDWYTDFDQALQVARREGKPLLADVGSENCPACRMLESQTLSHPEVQARLQNFVKVQIDGNSSPQILQQFGVNAYPTVIALDPNGRTVGRSVGYVPAAKFAGTLDGALRKAGPSLARAKAPSKHGAEASEESAQHRGESDQEEKTQVASGQEGSKNRTGRETVTAKSGASRMSGDSAAGDRDGSRDSGALYNMDASKSGKKGTASKTSRSEEKLLAQSSPEKVRREDSVGDSLPAPADGMPSRLLDLKASGSTRKPTGEDSESKTQISQKSGRGTSSAGALSTIQKLQSTSSKSAGSSASEDEEAGSEDTVTVESGSSLSAADVERWMTDADKHLKAGRKREARAMYTKVLEKDKDNRFGRSDLAFIQMVMLSVDTDDDALRRQAYSKITEFKGRFPNSTREDHYTVMRAILAADLGKTDEAHSLLDPFRKRFPTSRFQELAYQTWKSLPPVKGSGSSKRTETASRSNSGSSRSVANAASEKKSASATTKRSSSSSSKVTADAKKSSSKRSTED